MRIAGASSNIDNGGKISYSSSPPVTLITESKISYCSRGESSWCRFYRGHPRSMLYITIMLDIIMFNIIMLNCSSTHLNKFLHCIATCSSCWLCHRTLPFCPIGSFTSKRLLFTNNLHVRIFVGCR